jgi:hypothetical protein
VPEQAGLFAHNDIVLAALPGKICEHLLHATAWPGPSGLLGGGTARQTSGSPATPEHPGLAATELQHPQVAGSRPTRRSPPDHVLPAARTAG